MNSVIKASSYILVHVPDMVMANGTTQTTERIVNPESEYLKTLESHLRNYDSCLAYPPNQTFIGNLSPEELSKLEFPWYEQKLPQAQRFGAFGEIMPQDEFYLLLQIADEFELVKLSEAFVNEVKPRLAANPAFTPAILERLTGGSSLEQIEGYIATEHAEALYLGGKLVGCVKRAHDIDVNLSAHVMLENLVAKASGVLALIHGVRNAGLKPEEIEYVIDCCEEACGDQNQRGGGNFAKAMAETAGLTAAGGSDLRGFCAAPTHAIIEAAALVKAGVYRNVAVCAGGCTAKLGMNGKDHVKKGLPILEDCLGGFCFIITANDGVSTEIDLDHIGRHTVGTGSAPQAVIASLVTDPLDKAGLTILDVDKYSAEMQNPDVTKPAGAGDVPLANFKMIGALAVKRGWLDKKDLNSFIEEHGLPGFAPTQGHIPSGVPYIGFACQGIEKGELQRVMIIGKGSLFLGRLTNLFDGLSFMLQPNSAQQQSETSAVSTATIKALIAESMKDFAQSLLGDLAKE